jgi:hypothetical protein
MTKILSAKQKAMELGITTSGLAKTRHLYKHIKKSPHKYLYFAEDPREVVRPNTVNGPSTPGNSRTPRSNRRRGVPFGEENYHKAPGGSGNSLKVLNQMRAKASLEGRHSDKELNSMTEAMAIKIKDNHEEIVEKKQFELQTKITRENESLRKADPSYYARWLRGPTAPVVSHSSPWTPLHPKEPDEYERYTKEHLKDEKKFEYY